MVIFFSLRGVFNMPEINPDEKINIHIATHKSTIFHSHDYLELVYIVDGTAEHIINGTKMTVKKGDYFILDYNTVHKYTIFDSSKITLINCMFLPSFADKLLLNCRSVETLFNHYMMHINSKTLRQPPYDTVFFDDDGSIYKIIASMLEEFNQKQVGYLEIIRCNLIELLIRFTRKVYLSQTSLTFSDITSDIIKTIESEYMNELSLSSICKKYNYSLPYISKKFKSEVGISFVSYLQKVRIDEGCKLLLDTDKKIIDIANMIGYGDIKFFNSIFKKQLKTTPREFRKAYRGK